MDYQIMGYYFSTSQLIVALLILVVLIAIIVGVFIQRSRTRTHALRSRFGTEYDRAVLTQGSARKAELQLAKREDRVEEMKIRELGSIERDRFVADWQTLQSHFVDHPTAAVIEADNLVNALLEARGYPQSDFEQRAADISVHYPRVMVNYRDAHSIATRKGETEATTEELRTAMIHYRSIFDDLLQGQTPSKVRTAA
jgi:uncharacterized membrane protein